MNNPGKSLIAACIALDVGGVGLGREADACTRFVYHGANGEVITGRSMDYKVDTGTHLWIFPRGIVTSPRRALPSVARSLKEKVSLMGPA